MKRRRKAGVRVVSVFGAVVGIFVIVAAVGLWSLPPICHHPVGDPMRLDAASLKSAAMLYLGENGTGSCPTADDLRRELFFDGASGTDDIWGTGFRIECEADQAWVISAGPDLAFDTEDDFKASGF
jgi:hypothetical protein